MTVPPTPQEAEIAGVAVIYDALALAAKTRQDAYNETRETYRKHSENAELTDSARSEAFILSALFLSLAKAARREAEAMIAVRAHLQRAQGER